MKMMEESEYSQSAYSDYNYEQNNDHEWQQIGLLRQVNKRENEIKKTTVHMIRSPPESSKGDVRRTIARAARHPRQT